MGYANTNWIKKREILSSYWLTSFEELDGSSCDWELEIDTDSNPSTGIWSGASVAIGVNRVKSATIKP